MKALKLFLKALEELFPNTYFIDKLITLPHSTFKAYKEYKLEIWKLKDGHKDLLVTIQQSGKSTTSAQEDYMKEKITKEAIKMLWNLMNTNQA